jgi:transcriptional regulator with XRE-family HTH domain
MSRARRLHGLTLEVCAERAGVTVETWQRWEAGDDWPSEIEVLRVFGRVGRETLMRLGAAEGEG